MPQPRPPAVWLREGRPRRTRLSRERVVRAAIEILDAEGVPGLTMRRLAARLGCGVMSLYEYVDSKEDVLDLAVDEVIGEIELNEPASAAWREVLVHQLTQSRALLTRHPWVPGLMATRPLLGPKNLARSEFFYAALTRAGLQGPPLIAAVGTLTYYVQGFTTMENIWRDWLRGPGDEAELRAGAARYVAEQAERYPVLTEHAQLDEDDFDGQFLLGLETILDGIEARISG